jgi:hypothetical protein
MPSLPDAVEAQATTVEKFRKWLVPAITDT